MITSIYVDNYRCFSGFEYAPGNFELLIGDNGSGKTSLFDVLESLRVVITKGEPTEAAFPAESLCKWREASGGRQEFRLGIHGNDGQYQYSLVIEHDSQRLKNRIASERLTFNDLNNDLALYEFDGKDAHLFRDDGSAGPVFPFDWTRSGIATVPERQDNQRLTWFRRRMGEIYVFSPDPPAMESRTKKWNGHADRSLQNLSTWLHAMQSESFEVGSALSTSLRECIAGFSRHRFERISRSAHDLMIGFEFRDSATDAIVCQYELDFEALSEGQRNLVALYTVLHGAVKTGATVCIDEPDNFVALSEIQPWLLALEDAVQQQDCQCLLISHHPELMNHLAGNHGVCFSQDATGAAIAAEFDWKGEGGFTPSEVIARGWES